MAPIIQPSAFSVPGMVGPPRLHAYGRAIVNLMGDIEDCWPLDDRPAATEFRNIVPGRLSLNVLSGALATIPGKVSILPNDPWGRSAQFHGGGAWRAAAYTMPAIGTIEILTESHEQLADGSTFGNWNGNGVALLAAAPVTVRAYMNAANVTYNLLAVDRTIPMHLAVTWDGTTQRVYVNGIQRATQAVGSPTAGGYMGLGVYSSVLHGIVGRYQWATVYRRPLAPAELRAHALLAGPLA